MRYPIGFTASKNGTEIASGVLEFGLSLVL